MGGHALRSHGNYIVDHGKSWKNHGIVFLNFCGNPEKIQCIYICPVPGIHFMYVCHFSRLCSRYTDGDFQYFLEPNTPKGSELNE